MNSAIAWFTRNHVAANCLMLAIIACGAVSVLSMKIEIFPEMWHVFQLFVGKMPEARVAIDKVGAWLGGAVPSEA